MERIIKPTKKELGAVAAAHAAQLIKKSLAEKDEANIILATGASQFETMASLVNTKDIDWSKVTMFHLDEYIELDENHPASFRKYLIDRFISKVGELKNSFLVDGNNKSPEAECRHLGKIITQHPIDVALVGIGENGHLAFNDPPADFETQEPFLVVQLDTACRKQQLGEGWFPSLDDVPERAISMSIGQIMKSKNIIVSVPDERKAIAVKSAVEGPVTNMCPASILQTHESCFIYLDKPAASLLSLAK